ncbi:transketolase [Nematocida displodere]|uniref:transketolase n=1 Tax=Nematocida displodere TaxID=1805483 RepID=A0A177EJU3_9MICR|nr:transketolase [Nematocida displodere]
MKKAIDRIRVFVCEMVERAKSGHPGGPLGIAPVISVLFARILSISDKDPKWMGRDVFVMSNGHCCALLYLNLHLLGLLPFEELLRFRQLGSKTPGHPEFSDVIEATTGPLGQGVGQSVGYAIALKNLEKFNRESFTLFRNRVFCLVGDGCMQEGVSHEAFSLAGHLVLNNLVFIYDYNQVTIDGPTSLSTSENVSQRMSALGYEVSEITDPEDLEEIEKILQAAPSKPHFIIVHTCIGKGSLKEGSEKTHGAPLGPEDIAQMKQKYQISENFALGEEVTQPYQQQRLKNRAAHKAWKKLLRAYAETFPEEYARLAQTAPEIASLAPERLLAREEARSSRSTREHLSWILAELAASERILGGSADLTPSNLTMWPGAKVFSKEDRGGRYIHFGIREHGMAAVLNGIAAYGWHLPFGATFLNFITYAFPALRIAALSGFHVVALATHDSIALGEDGPTHQPVETLALLRATPNLCVLRPADGVETLFAVHHAFFLAEGPCVVVLTRQRLPHLPGTSFARSGRGAYVVSDYSAEGTRVLIGATGSELSLAMEVKKHLPHLNIRVVSFVSTDLFDRQAPEYQASLLSSDVSFSVEALSTLGWHKYVNYPYGLDTFGASAPGPEVYEHFGFTVRHVSHFITETLACFSLSQGL